MAALCCVDEDGLCPGEWKLLELESLHFPEDGFAQWSSLCLERSVAGRTGHAQETVLSLGQAALAV